MKLFKKSLSAIFILCFLKSCFLGTIVGGVVDVGIEVVKVPFKVGGAIIDGVSGDDDAKSDELDEREEELEKREQDLETQEKDSKTSNSSE